MSLGPQPASKPLKTDPKPTCSKQPQQALNKAAPAMPDNLAFDARDEFVLVSDFYCVLQQKNNLLMLNRLFDASPAAELVFAFRPVLRIHPAHSPPAACLLPIDGRQLMQCPMCMPSRQPNTKILNARLSRKATK